MLRNLDVPRAIDWQSDMRVSFERKLANKSYKFALQSAFTQFYHSCRFHLRMK